MSLSKVIFSAEAHNKALDFVNSKIGAEVGNIHEHIHNEFSVAHKRRAAELSECFMVVKMSLIYNDVSTATSVCAKMKRMIFKVNKQNGSTPFFNIERAKSQL